MTGFTQNDITATQGGSAASGILSNFRNTVAGTEWTIDVTPTTDGEVTLDIAANVATAADAGSTGAGNTAAVQATSTYDGTDPTVVSIERQDPMASPTNANSLTWRVSFSEPVKNVDVADFVVSGTTPMAQRVAAVSPGPEGSMTWNFTAEGGDLADLTGEVTLSFDEDQNITDVPGRSLTNTAPTSRARMRTAMWWTTPRRCMDRRLSASEPGAAADHRGGRSDLADDLSLRRYRSRRRWSMPGRRTIA